MLDIVEAPGGEFARAIRKRHAFRIEQHGEQHHEPKNDHGDGKKDAIELEAPKPAPARCEPERRGVFARRITGEGWDIG